MTSSNRCLSLMLVLALAASACGQVSSAPTAFDPAAYTPIAADWLAAPEAHQLKAGQWVQCRAYFWEFLSYDPGIRYYYFNQIRFPQRWGALEWFAIYQQPTMTGYFDRLAMSYAQRLEYQPKRLDQIIIYGELLPFGGRQIYLLVHHLEPAPEQ